MCGWDINTATDLEKRQRDHVFKGTVTKSRIVKWQGGACQQKANCGTWLHDYLWILAHNLLCHTCVDGGILISIGTK